MRVIALFAILALASLAMGEELIFRATDQNFLPSCAANGLENAKPPLALHPNTDAAYAAFRSRLNKDPTFYSFETEAEGQLPNPHSFVFPDPTESVTASIVCENPSGVCGYNIKNDTQDGLADANFANCPSLNGRYPITGDQWLDVELNDDFSISFNPPVKGFSFFASDIGDRLGSLFILVQRADGSRIQVNGNDNIPLVQVFSEADRATSGARTFFAVFTTEPATAQDSRYFTKVFFNKTVPPNAPSNDGFGFDEFAVLTKTFDPVGLCDCLFVYNWNPSCSFPNGLSVQDAQECACIKYVTDLDFPACSTRLVKCGNGVITGGTQGSGGDPSAELRGDFSDNYLPALVQADS